MVFLLLLNWLFLVYVMVQFSLHLHVITNITLYNVPTNFFNLDKTLYSNPVIAAVMLISLWFILQL